MQPFRGTVEVMPGWIEGVLQHGHGVASGANSESPYPKGFQFKHHSSKLLDWIFLAIGRAQSISVLSR
jgi:hypothetical protein